MYDALGILSSLQNSNAIGIMVDYVIDDINVMCAKYINIPVQCPSSPQAYISAVKSILYLTCCIIELDSFYSFSIKYKLHQIVKMLVYYYNGIKTYNKKYLTLFEAYLELCNMNMLKAIPP